MAKIPFEEFCHRLKPVESLVAPGQMIRRWREGMTVEQALADIKAHPWQPDLSRWEGKPAPRDPRLAPGTRRAGPLLPAHVLERLVWRAILDELIRVRARRMEPDTRRRYMALRQECARRLKKGS